jgi:hypothetical protein
VRRIYSSRDTLAVDQRHDLLERAGIASQVRNRDLHGLVGGLPPTECWVELWVLDDDDVTEAEAVIAAAQDQPADGLEEVWRCRRCGEVSPGALDACWHCGAPRLATAPAAPFTSVEDDPVVDPVHRDVTALGFWALLIVLVVVAYWMLRAYTRPWEF